MKYQSFNTQQNKLQTSFTNKEVNRQNLKILEPINTTFRSVNFNKDISIVTIADEDLITTSANDYSIIFNNIPNWAVTMAKPFYYFSAGSGFDFSKTVDNFSIAFSNGTLKLNDVSIIRWNVQYWWSQLGENTFKFFLRTNINIRYVTNLSEFGFGSEFFPIYLSVKIQLVNNKEFYEVQ